ncbi:hypothetical protein VP01_766g2, partial [Puccinia sorghi]
SGCLSKNVPLGGIFGFWHVHNFEQFYTTEKRGPVLPLIPNGRQELGLQVYQHCELMGLLMRTPEWDVIPAKIHDSGIYAWVKVRKPIREAEIQECLETIAESCVSGLRPRIHLGTEQYATCARKSINVNNTSSNSGNEEEMGRGLDVRGSNELTEFLSFAAITHWLDSASRHASACQTITNLAEPRFAKWSGPKRRTENSADSHANQSCKSMAGPLAGAVPNPPGIPQIFNNAEMKTTFVFLASFLVLVPLVCCAGKNSPRKLHKKQMPSPSEDWMILGSHGLMLTHYKTGPKHVNGLPVISRRDSDISLFSSTLAGMTSSPDDIINFDSALVTDLKTAPLAGLTTRDVVTRNGLVHLTRNSKGKDEVRIEASSLLTKPLTLSPYHTKTNSHRFIQVKRSAKKSKAKLIKSLSRSKSLPSLFNPTHPQLDVMKGAIIQTKITWYTGHDLLNPYCAQKCMSSSQIFALRTSSLIIAVTQKWTLRPKCGDFFELSVVDKHAGQIGKSVIARVVDLCGGCAPQVAHADLSKAAFTKLFNLDVGVVSGLAMRKVAPPKKWNKNLYGPRIL